MSYEFIKLSEVEQVETSYNANLLIEENGEIKRLSTANINFGGSGNQVQADWNETDDTSPAYIANKPSMAGNNIIKYTLSCGGQMYLNGEAQTVQQVVDAWESGAVLRFNWDWDSGTVAGRNPIINMSYELGCGGMMGTIVYLDSYNDGMTINNYGIR